MSILTSLLPRRAFLALPVLGLTLGSLPLAAELLVHEPFDYERRQGFVNADLTGEGIDGLNGGLGFSSAWAKENAGNLNSGIPVGADDYAPNDGWGVVPGGREAPLAYVDANNNHLITSGHQIRTAFGLRSWDRRDLSTTIGQPGSSVWLSFIGQAHGSAGSQRWAFVELASWGSSRVWIGNVNAIANGNWGFQLPDRSMGAVSVDLGVPMTEPTMFLARFDHASDWSNMTLSIWLNPPDLTDEGALPEPNHVVITDFTQFSMLGVAGRYSTDFDEIRIGTTFDSVTPSEFIPPPAAAPTLAIVRDGASVVVSWPAAATNYSLYSSEDLVSWAPVSAEPTVEGESNVVEVDTAVDRLFFRLQP